MKSKHYNLNKYFRYLVKREIQYCNLTENFSKQTGIKNVFVFTLTIYINLVVTPNSMIFVENEIQ